MNIWPLLLILTAQVKAASVSIPPAGASITWTASVDAAVIGYHVYYGTFQGTLTYEIDAGNNLTTTVVGLDVGRTYYFSVTAYDAAGCESDLSGEVPFVVSQTLVIDFGATRNAPKVVAPGSFLESSTDMVNWFPRDATLVSNQWHVVINQNIPREFYRSEGSTIK